MKVKDRNLLIILFALLSISFYFTSCFLSSYNPTNIQEIFTTYIVVLVTILSLTISLIIIGLQFISTQLSNKLLSFLLNSKETMVMIGLYIFTILFNLICINFIQSQISLSISTVLLIISLFYLIFYFYYIVENFNEGGLIEYLDKKIGRNLSNKNYSNLKELCLGYIQKNNIKNFQKVLK